MAKESLHQLRADLKACRAEVDDLMELRVQTKEHHERDLCAAVSNERQKIAVLANCVEALSQLLKVTYDQRAE